MFTIAFLVSGCAYLYPAVEPIPGEYYNYDDSNSTLVLLLPGIGDSPASFVKQGTVGQVRACRPDANILGVDSHFAYFRAKTIIERLREDLIQPARDAGVREIWLLGVSLGGLGSLLYRQQHPDEVKAVIVMAPYLGEATDLDSYLSGDGDLQASIPPRFVSLWDGLTGDAARDPAITLAFGDNDKNHRQLQWLASLMDQSRVVRAPGGHNWGVWSRLWPEAMRRSGLCN